MRRRTKWLILVFLCVLLAVGGLRTDIDYCKITAASIHSTKIWGLTISKKEYEGYRPWLKEEIGLDLPSEFVDYLEFHPFFAVASTPPGNWLTLRRARQIYEKYPATQPHVKEVLLRLGSRETPTLEIQDRLDLDTLAKQAEQGVAPQSATRSESNSEGSDKPQPESKPRPR